MKRLSEQMFVVIVFICASGLPVVCRGQAAVPLPEGVRAVWDVEKAYRRSTPTRQRICINGLWQWQPSEEETNNIPTDRWGYFKVPGCWPGITDYMQKDCQRLYAHPSWKNRNLRSITRAWYQRKITIPAEWAERRITIQSEYLNSYATIFVDGRNTGTIIFPGGELDDIGRSVTAMERAGFEVHDVEGWRRHYALTCEHWVNALVEKRAEAIAEIGEEKYRIWIAYLAGVSLAFSRGTLRIFQTLVSKSPKRAPPLPPTRADLYR